MKQCSRSMVEAVLAESQARLSMVLFVGVWLFARETIVAFALGEETAESTNTVKVIVVMIDANGGFVCVGIRFESWFVVSCIVEDEDAELSRVLTIVVLLDYWQKFLGTIAVKIRRDSSIAEEFVDEHSHSYRILA